MRVFLIIEVAIRVLIRKIENNHLTYSAVLINANTQTHTLSIVAKIEYSANTYRSSCFKENYIINLSAKF